MTKAIALDALGLLSIGRLAPRITSYTFAIEGDEMTVSGGNFMLGFRYAEKIDNPDGYAGEFSLPVSRGFLTRMPLSQSVNWSIDDVLREVSYTTHEGLIVTAKMGTSALMEPVGGEEFTVDLTDLFTVPILPHDILTASNGHLYLGNLASDFRWLLRANAPQEIPEFTVPASILSLLRVLGLTDATTIAVSPWHVSVRVGDDYVYTARLNHNTDAPEAIMKGMLTTPIANAVPIPATWRDIVGRGETYELESQDGYLRLRDSQALLAEAETREDAPEWRTGVNGALLGGALAVAGAGATVALSASPHTLLIRGAKVALMVPTKEST